MEPQPLSPIATETGGVPAQQSESASLLTVIERLATDPDSDMAKLEKMIELQERAQDRVAKQAFSAAFAAMKPELPKIIKSRKNDQTKSKYASIDDINAKVDPVLAKHGFADMCRIEQTDTHVTVVMILMHRDGHREETPFTLQLDLTGAQGTVNKTKIHAAGSSVTYARRYAKCAMLGISLGDHQDDDGNGASACKKISKFQAEVLEKILDDCSDPCREWFAEKYGDVSELPAERFTELSEMLKKRRVVNREESDAAV